MKIFTVEISAGVTIDITQDDDGKFIAPDFLQGLGTALKPAAEFICVARKPIDEKTVANNIAKWGTGAFRIDECRVPSLDGDRPMTAEHVAGNRSRENYRTGVPVNQRPSEKDRWPATILHDGSDEVITAFPDSAGQQGDVKGTEPSTPFSGVVYGEMAGRFEAVARNDGEGSSARFFNSFPGRDSDVKRIHYDSKASADMRVGSDHPTVKNIDLMQWLVRLVTPIGGTTIDPFAGTGTTGEAAYREGLSAILIEREPTYQQDIRRRMALVLAGPDERSRESLKASGKVESVDTLPLFGGKDEQS